MEKLKKPTLHRTFVFQFKDEQGLRRLIEDHYAWLKKLFLEDKDFVEYLEERYNFLMNKLDRKEFPIYQQYPLFRIHKDDSVHYEVFQLGRMVFRYIIKIAETGSWETFQYFINNFDSYISNEALPFLLGEGKLYTTIVPLENGDFETEFLEKLNLPEYVKYNLEKIPFSKFTYFYLPFNNRTEKFVIEEVILLRNEEIENSEEYFSFLLEKWNALVSLRLKINRVFYVEFENKRKALKEKSFELKGILDEVKDFSKNHSLKKAEIALIKMSPICAETKRMMIEAEEIKRVLEEDFRNLENIANRILNLFKENKELAELFITEHNTNLRQMDASLLFAKFLLEEANHRLQMFSTLADILEAKYERLLNWVIGIVGSFLASVNAVDKETVIFILQNIESLYLKTTKQALTLSYTPLTHVLVRLGVAGFIIFLFYCFFKLFDKTKKS